MTRHLRHVILALAAVALLASCGNCRSADDGPAPDAGPDRPLCKSDKAPYQVRLPTGWRREDPNSLNPHADLAASRDDRLFLIVIPQQLPDIDGVDPPNAGALKEASVERMRDNVEQFEIEREGPVTLEHGDGTSLFAEGVVDDNPVQYVATFVTHGQWGYQIIAWGPAGDESELVESVDALIGGWQFRDGSRGPDSADGGSASAPETSGSPTPSPEASGKSSSEQ